MTRILCAGVDAASYYRMNQDGDLVVHPDGGCALNSSAPVVKQLVVDSLRHWVMEYHIDGFFVHNTDELQHGRAGELLTYSELLESLAMDPVLRAAKLYAGVTSDRPPMPHWEVWGERNPCFRDDIWRFLRGAPNSKGMFATRLCGSADRLGARGAGYGLNSVAGPKTSTLVDSVDSPIEFAGAEDEEGAAAKPAALGSAPLIPQGELPVKHRQVRNALLALFLSQGVPVVAMGDEYGHTRGGAPCAPPSAGEPNLFRWDAVGEAGPQAAKHLLQFQRQLAALRKRRPELSSAVVHSKCKSRFFGTELHEPDWESAEPQLAVMFTSSDIRSPGGVYCAFNPSSSSATFNLPPPPAGTKWWQLLDTRLMESQITPISSSTSLTLAPFSAVLVEATTASPPSF
ncbi:[4Fe-4S] proteins maturation [Cymbomonas tetramitiformis]|uniref:[4Fe-4S] proteins maturation n=1 Tax=Cymbomonas tetramitiformis TaxID=36881 RepID=A0AAE0C6U4_9CHLO|nr:[4Fe-4S] proteins maturation [Cymbomonas tetramitiformis]